MVKVGGTYWLIWSGNEWNSGNYRMGQAALQLDRSDRAPAPVAPRSSATRRPARPRWRHALHRTVGSAADHVPLVERAVHELSDQPELRRLPACAPRRASAACTSTAGRRGGCADGRPGRQPRGGHRWAGSHQRGGMGARSSTTGAIDVHVYVDDAVAVLSANGSRPDVGSAFGLGSSHGFATSIGAAPGPTRCAPTPSTSVLASIPSSAAAR